MAKLVDLRYNHHYIPKDDGEMVRVTELIFLTSKPKYIETDESIEKSYVIDEHRIEILDHEIDVIIKALTTIKEE